MGFLEELRRRKVFHVAAVYAVVAWLLAQVIVTVKTPLNLPAWADSLVILLLLIGFPIALIMSWAYHLSPESKVQESSAGDPATGTGRTVIFALIGVSIVAAGWMVYRIGQDSSNTRVDAATAAATAAGNHAAVAAGPPGGAIIAPPSSRPRLAILPFENLSPDPNNAFFTDGIHEEILTALVNTAPGLEVVSRTTMMLYRNAPKTATEIARELGATHVLEGSVRRDDDRVRLTLQLIDGRTDNHLWAHSYEHTLTDTLTLQAEVAAAVAGQLAVRLAGNTISAAGPSGNPAAYDLYLKARVAMRNLNGGMPVASWNEAETLLSRAIDSDPSFPRAYLQRLFVHIGMYTYGYDPGPGRLEAARQDLAALRGLAPGDPAVPAGEALLEFAEMDYQQALRSFEAAESAGMTDPDMLVWKAWLLMQSGRNDDAASLFERMLELDPVNPYVLGLAWFNFMQSHRPEQALRMLALAETLAPQGNLWQILRHSTLFAYTGDLEHLALLTSRENVERLTAASGPVPTDAAFDYDDVIHNTASRLVTQGRLAEARRVLGSVSKATLRMPIQAYSYFAIGISPTPVADPRGWLDLLLGDGDAAAEQGRLVLDFVSDAQVTPRSGWYLKALAADANLFLGRREQAVAAADELIQQTTGSLDVAVHIAAQWKAANIYAWAGAQDRAVQYLEQLYRSSPGIPPGIITRSPVLSMPLADQPRYQSLLRQLEADMAVQRLE